MRDTGVIIDSEDAGHLVTLDGRTYAVERISHSEIGGVLLYDVADISGAHQPVLGSVERAHSAEVAAFQTGLLSDFHTEIVREAIRTNS